MIIKRGDNQPITTIIKSGEEIYSETNENLEKLKKEVESLENGNNSESLKKKD